MKLAAVGALVVSTCACSDDGAAVASSRQQDDSRVPSEPNTPDETDSGIAPNARDAATSTSEVPNEGEGDAGGEADAAVTFPVPVKPPPPPYVNPGQVADLAPSEDCVHPPVEADCTDGFCRVLPGCSVLGAPLERTYVTATAPQVQVTLTHEFWIGETEVTNAQWLDAGFELPLRDVDVGRCTAPECPVSNVNFYEALTFLNSYSEQQGLTPCYQLIDCTGTFGSGPICNRAAAESGTLDCDRTEEDGLACGGVFISAATPYECEGYRLPTAAEWEYAARAGTRTATWLGNIAWNGFDAPSCPGPNPNLDPIAWYCWNAEETAHPVKQKWPNPWGLFDILGNLNEWTSTPSEINVLASVSAVDPVSDWYDSVGYEQGALLPTSADVAFFPGHDIPLALGGNFDFGPNDATTEARSAYTNAQQGNSLVGFRMVRTAHPNP